MPYSRRQILKNLSVGGASLAMAPFVRSLQVHAAGKDEALPKRFVFVVKSSGIDKHNLVPEGLARPALGRPEPTGAKRQRQHHEPSTLQKRE